MATFNQVTGGGVVYNGATGKILPPWFGGQGVLRALLAFKRPRALLSLHAAACNQRLMLPT